MYFHVKVSCYTNNENIQAYVTCCAYLSPFSSLGNVTENSLDLKTKTSNEQIDMASSNRLENYLNAY